MTSDSIITEGMPFATAQEREEELLRARQVLMAKLEASLQGSRKALLALDLPQIECETGDQIGLILEFGALLRRCKACAAADRSAEPRAPGLRTPFLELEEELERSQNRILDALRLQAALLTRTQRKLRVLANMLAGPTVSYGPLLARDGGPARLNWKQEERADSCRA
jgi:hypothetical protein